MEKEFKIQELANFWGVSVPTTWNRINKEGLITFKKKDQTGKEVSYVNVSEETLGKYINNVINNNVATNSNLYYEEILTDNNVTNNNNNVNYKVNNGSNADNKPLTQKELLTELKSIYNDNNNKLEQVRNELVEYKSKMLYLEDKANREGYYINEINELQTNNKRLETLIERFKYVTMGLLLVLSILITIFIMTNKPKVEEVAEPETKIEQVAPTPAQVEVKPVQQTPIKKNK